MQHFEISNHLLSTSVTEVIFLQNTCDSSLSSFPLWHLVLNWVSENLLWQLADVLMFTPVERLFLSLASTLLFGQLCCDSFSWGLYLLHFTGHHSPFSLLTVSTVCFSLLKMDFGCLFPFSAVGEKESRTWSWESRWPCSHFNSVCFFWTSLAASQFPKTWIGAIQIGKSPTTWEL